jgi:hypothetical protein
MKSQDARYIPPRRERDEARRRWRDRYVRRLALAAVILDVALVALTLIYWRAEAEYSDQQQAMKGNTVTCNTSFKDERRTLDA